MDYKNDLRANIFLNYIENECNNTTDPELQEFVIEDFFKIDEEDEIVSYIFSHTKPNEFDINDTDKILKRIFGLNQTQEIRALAFVKFINSHDLPKFVNYDLFAEILINEYQITTNLLLISLASLIIISEKLIVNLDFIKNLMEDDIIFTEEFWTFCICYRKIELPLKTNELLQIGIFETANNFFQNFEQFIDIPIKTVQIVFQIILSTLEIGLIPDFLKYYQAIIDAAYYFKDSFIESYFFILIFDEKCTISENMLF